MFFGKRLVASPLSIMFHVDYVLRKVHLWQIKNNSREFFNRFIHKNFHSLHDSKSGANLCECKHNEPKVQASSAEQFLAAFKFNQIQAQFKFRSLIIHKPLFCPLSFKFLDTKNILFVCLCARMSGLNEMTGRDGVNQTTPATKWGD